MRAFEPALLVVVLALAAVPVSAAPTPDDDTLYAHATNCGDGATFWMNTEKDDPDHDDGGCGYLATAPTLGHTWEIPLDPDPNASIPLDADGVVNMTAEFAVIGTAQVEVDTALTAGETVVADPDAKTAGVAGLGRFNVSWELKPQVDEVPANETLTWTITVDGASTPIYLEMNDDGWSQVRLPVQEAQAVQPAAESGQAASGSDGGSAASDGTGSTGKAGSTDAAPGQSTPGFSMAALLGAAAAAAVVLRRRQDRR